MAFKNSGDMKPFADKVWQREYYWLNRDKNLDFIRVFED